METSSPETFTTSPTTEKLDAALAKAQGEILGAHKDKLNPAFRSKYADLAAVFDACRPALSKHGIAVTQWPVHSTDNRLHIITRLACGGEWLKAHFSIPVSKADAHGYGSATTYARRFALSAAVGVAPDEDDDGNGAVANPSPWDSGRKQARPQASAKEAREAKPPEAQPGASAAAQDAAKAVAETHLRARINRLWAEAKKGMSKVEFTAWVERVVGHARPSSELTEDEVGQLEAALPGLIEERKQ